MTELEKEALENVLEYLYEHERKDYHASPSDHHIFNDLVVLDNSY